MTAMWLGIGLGAAIAAAVVVAGGWWLRTQFPTLARAALREMGEAFLSLARGELAVEREKGVRDLEARRQAVETAVQGLEEQVRRYEVLMRTFESDRDQKFGLLKGELERVIQGNDQLQRTTANLVAVLGNARIRGQWGQKMADDILRLCGLVDGIHYRREQELAAGRPDYTFFLPDDHRLFMDVKFPLDNYVRFASARDEDQRGYREAFLRDVREHLREMERRNYVAQADRAVDYVIIFIPNEQVYGLLNEWLPALIDECLPKKTILCGPWTLYAIVRIIWQAWQHYHYSLAVGDIVRAINGFLQDFGKFKERFVELGELLQRTEEKYQEITTKSYQRLDGRIRRIEDYRQGHHLPEESVGQVPDRVSVGCDADLGGSDA